MPTAPLAERMRPQSLEEFVGQYHLLAEGRPLARLAEQGQIFSMILWGPPGTGKTTLAKLLSDRVGGRWEALSAVLAGVREVREAIARAKENSARRTVLFLDEVHRFSKSQQDVLLPHVERGTVVLIGATVENPSFEVNSALLSRMRVFVLRPLAPASIRSILIGALDKEYPNLEVEPESLDTLCAIADGDARRALNTLELATQLTDSTLKVDDVVAASGQSYRRFDKGGDAFYDQISALHKSVRGSSPDAALYWLARMLDGGCDPLYIARRLVRMATEDIGTADPDALAVALGAWDAFHRLGSPEGELALAEAVVYLSVVPKSNAVMSAFDGARSFVASHPSWDVPLRLRNAPTELAKSLGHGKGYRYAHDYVDGFVAGEEYFPDEVEDEVFYEPKSRGFEERIKARLDTLRSLNKRARSD